MNGKFQAGFVSVGLLLVVHLPAFAGSITTLPTLTVLPTPRGMQEAEGWAIDETGTEVVGYAAAVMHGDPLPAMWKGHTATMLDGDIVTTEDGTEAQYPIQFGIAVGMDQTGTIAAQVWNADVGSFAALWNPKGKVWQALPRAIPGVSCSARGINALGDVAGMCAGYAVLWRDGEPTLLPPLNPTDWCYAYAVNDFGVVAGLCWAGGTVAAGGHSVAVVWEDGVAEDLWGNPSDFDNAYARDINDSGVVVGIQRQTAMKWEPDVMKSVELAPVGAANGVNEAGDATGFVGVNGGAARAKVWKADGSVVDLGLLPDGSFSWGRAINDAGVVTGMADDADGYEHAVVFTP